MKKHLSMLLIFITILGLSIGYSALNTDLSISGNAEFIVSYDIAKNKILNDNGGANYIKSKEPPDFSKTANTDEGMFATLDNDGTSYYYRGAVENNWLYFAGYYWRIIRVNGNGSVRLIYNGTKMNQTGEETYIADSFFSSGYDDNAYVGYMYGTPNSTTYEETHANVNESVVKKMLENWYHDNLLDYNDDIEERVGFCGDRTPSTASSSINYLGGTGKTHTYYRGFIDLYVNYTPTLKCANVNDYYTTGNNVNGNKTLIYPIGLITADELVYAGGKLSVGNENTNFYLYTGHDYWTMTPFAFYSFTGYSYDFILTATGFINNGYPFSESVGVRPVINLKANTMISGTGTMNDPYKVVG